MKCLRFAVALSILYAVALGGQDSNRPLRVELARMERISGYSLADVSWTPDVGIAVVSVENRTEKNVEARNAQKLISSECFSADGKYSVFFRDGLQLWDIASAEARQIDSDGWYSRQCFSPDGKFVYSSRHRIKVFDLAKKQITDIESGDYPSWSPNGNWLAFDDGKNFVILKLESGGRTKLFNSRNSSGANWSPDSRYLTFTKPGGSTGGFLIWGIKCPEPYRVWVWRVEDGAHDWVQEICKPGRAFVWVKNSDLVMQ